MKSNFNLWGLILFVGLFVHCGSPNEQSLNETTQSATEVTTNEANPLNGLTQINQPTNYHVDRINGIQIDEVAQPVRLNQRYLQIAGWAFDAVSMKPASSVYIDIDGKFFKANYGLSKESVAEKFNNNDLANCAFEAKVDSRITGKGTHKLSLKIISADGSSYFVTAKTVIQID